MCRRNSTESRWRTTCCVTRAFSPELVAGGSRPKAMTKSTAVPTPPHFEHAPDLLRLRSHAATVRALLGELERIVPCTGGSGEIAIGGQLIEELAWLGYRVLDCVGTMSTPTQESLRLPRAWANDGAQQKAGPR